MLLGSRRLNSGQNTMHLQRTYSLTVGTVPKDGIHIISSIVNVESMYYA